MMAHTHRTIEPFFHLSCLHKKGPSGLLSGIDWALSLHSAHGGRIRKAYPRWAPRDTPTRPNRAGPDGGGEGTQERKRWATAEWAAA
jgi:hypothetical protein